MARHVAFARSADALAVDAAKATRTGRKFAHTLRARFDKAVSRGILHEEDWEMYEYQGWTRRLAEAREYDEPLFSVYRAALRDALAVAA